VVLFGRLSQHSTRSGASQPASLDRGITATNPHGSAAASQNKTQDSHAAD
jgi:hypothetical protein